MRYSNAKEIVAMTLVWALALIVYDKTFSKQLYKPTPERVAQFTTPEVGMLINHVACSGSTEEVARILKMLPWLGEPKFTEQKKPQHTAFTGGMCALRILVGVRDIGQADFVVLADTLRKISISPAELEFGGIPHFALKAEVPRFIDCPSCVEAAQAAVSPKKDLKVQSTFKWLDSARVDPAEQTITAYARFGYEAHVEELMQALDQAGFPPTSIRIVVGQ